jgi:hypothetical protein
MADISERLGYGKKWFDYGFLDLKALAEQELRFETGDDHNPEHYRFGAFRSVLKSRTSLSGEDVDHYIELASEDPDQEMGRSALKELAQWPHLAESEYRKLSTHAAFQSTSMRGALMWGKLIRDLNSSSLTSESCDSYIEKGNSEVQRLLIDRASLSREQFERLREVGKSRAVRNMAAAKLRVSRSRLQGAAGRRAQ